MRHVDIYGTIGPMCSDVETLAAMFDAGMTGIRLNLSHVTLKESENLISNLHKAAEMSGVKAQLLIDLQGPELRIGRMNAPLDLREGDVLGFMEQGDPDARKSQALRKIVTVPKEVLLALSAGREALLDDGKILARVLENTGHTAKATILRGGVLTGRKSIAIPGTKIDIPTMTQADIRNIEVAREYGVTAVMQPFVRNREDLITVRKALRKSGNESIALFAKIENMDGVRQIDELIAESDHIVIARGDLGNAVKLWELPGVQKYIAAKCRAAARDFMVVTQMLSSMETHPVPTRAEVSDIFNAVLDGASSVMVTGETAVGRYPVLTISYLARTADEALKFHEAQ
ncbi:MAG: pyruvate kinase [Lachnospiraceae bacterium]|nr:pyruvate kinase [Lachnospiraceae bacterium]